MAIFDEILSQIIKIFKTNDNLSLILKNQKNENEIKAGINIIKSINLDCLSTPGTSFFNNEEPLNTFSKQMSSCIFDQKIPQSFFKNNQNNFKKNNNTICDNAPLDLSTTKREKEQKFEPFNQNQTNLPSKLLLEKLQPLAKDIKTTLFNTGRKRKQDNSESSSDSYKTQSEGYENSLILDVTDQNLISKNVESFDHLINKRQRLMCECGVSFLAEETLNGHKMYYCKNRILSDEEKVQPVIPIKVIIQSHN